MSYMLQHLHNGWQVDQAILSEEDRVVVIRFGHDWDPTCMKMDEVLYSIVEKVCALSPSLMQKLRLLCLGSFEAKCRPTNGSSPGPGARNMTEVHCGEGAL